MLDVDPRVLAALDRDLVGFLTAVNQAGQPQTSPVWFLRQGDDLIVYNQPTTGRLTSIASNPRVAFNLRADPLARGAVTLEGTAVIDPGLPPAHELADYVAKYGDEISRLGWTPKSFSGEYSVPIRIEVTRVRKWGLAALDE